jgi:hypothetical protein
MTSFEEILARTSNEVERPKPYPVGTYLCMVDGPAQFGKVGQNQTDVIDFNLKINQPIEDVDQQAVADMGGVAGKRTRVRFFLTEAAIWRLDDFLINHLGIDDAGISTKERIAMAPGRPVLATIKHRTSPDGAQVFAEVGSTAKP